MKNYDEIVIRYLDKQLSESELKKFELELKNNEDLKKALDSYRELSQLFSGDKKPNIRQGYFNEIVPKFRQRMEKKSNTFPTRKIGFAFVIILLMIALYVILNVNVLNPKFEELTLQSITENISEEELGELADYVSDDSWRLLYDNSDYELLKEDDLILERIVENVSDADRLILLNDYQINNFYSFIDDNEIENAYNELLTIRIL
ncbi:MAG: hypothetical protein O6940_10850 [Ignavibacteria bacterium]|nr:hypothetical protein [Ignavibacteria bacterium]